MIIVVVIMGIFFNKLRRLYITVAGDLKQLEGICKITKSFHIFISPSNFSVKSPVFSHVNASINGLTTIRASEVELALEYEFDLHQVG